MYIPARFQEKDQETIFNFIEQNSFATLVTYDGKIPVATHLPILVERDSENKIYLVGHLARANEQWKTFAENEEVLIIFSGAHAYISPRWYDVPEQNVPTWNYQAIHVYGTLQIIENKAELFNFLEKLIKKFEPKTGYSFDSISPEVNEKLVKGIVGFRIETTRVEASFKLSQHRPEFHAGVIAGLIENGDENSLKIAEAMRNLQ